MEREIKEKKKQIDWTIMFINALNVFVAVMIFISCMVILLRYGFNIIDFGIRNKWEIIFNIGLWYAIAIFSVNHFYDYFKLEYKKC